MDLLLVNCPSPTRSDVLTESKHLGLSYIAAYLRAHGFQADVLDAASEGLNLETMTLLIEASSASVLGITMYYNNVLQVLELTERVKRAQPGLLVLVGGHTPTFAYDEIVHV